jgi:hypothetical protein
VLQVNDNETSEIDLNLELVAKYQRENQDRNLEKVLALIDIELLNSKLSKGLLFILFVVANLVFMLARQMLKYKIYCI